MLKKTRSKLDPVRLSSHQQEARHNLRLPMSIRDLRMLYTQAQIGGWSSIIINPLDLIYIDISIAKKLVMVG